MRSPLKLSALLALVLLTFSLIGGTGVGAQVDAPDVEADTFQPEDLEGLQHGVARSYTIDFEAMIAASSTPGADFPETTGLLFIGGLVLEFDNDGNAEAGFDRMMEEVDAQGLLEDEEAEVEEWDSGLGNRSVAYLSSFEYEGTRSDTAIIIVQQDNYLYMISGSGTDVDMKDLSVSFGQLVIDNDGSGEGEFNADGTSTGGLWDKFPASDHELVTGLIASDEILYPETEGES